MIGRLCAAAIGVLALLGCDGNVLVGYGPAPMLDQGDDATADAGARPDAGSAALDAAVVKPARDAAISVVHRDAGDSDAAIDSGPTEELLPAVSWKTGAHAANDLQDYLDFGTWRGRALDLASLYPERTTWEGLTSPGWPVDMFAPFAGRLLLSVPLYPEGMGNNQECATGAYDDKWKQLGTFLVDRNRADTILRLGWGFNDNEHAWRADADPMDWIECFRSVVSALRTTDPEIAIDWSFNMLGAPTIASGDPYAGYPGDAYVDFVGLEAFDMYPPTHDDAAWDAKCNSPSGLCRLAEFAREHDKQLGIAEWGGVACGADPGDDNPFFILKMFETFAANADIMGYEAYFQDGDGKVCSTLKGSDKNVAAAAKYQELYGPR